MKKALTTIELIFASYLITYLTLYLIFRAGIQRAGKIDLISILAGVIAGFVAFIVGYISTKGRGKKDGL